MRWKPGLRVLLTLLTLLTVLVAAGCADRNKLASRLKGAATGQHLPKLVACWEKTFEAAEYSGEYVAVVDFTVSSSGAISDATVADLTELTGAGQAQLESFRACLVDGLNHSSLKLGGMAELVEVVGYRIAFADASKKARQDASEQAPTLLIGPRTDRCQGLYGHDPPRDVAQLHKLLDEAQNEAANSELDNQDRHARALQKSYDLALELAERASLDLRREDLAEEGRKRIRRLRRSARETTEQVGARIGCQPPH